MDADDDLAFALFLQEQFNSENNGVVAQKSSKLPTSLVDPSWEYIDPNPDIRQLFLQFNDEYFDGLLAGVEVRWSPRMTLCAGLCCYEGRGGLCSVRLSEPLLKLRPRKDLVETLLHEMIHALLFVTQNNKDHDGHGPEFHKHMYRINKQAGTNISVYHNFHDEVNAYRQHWWKCNGPCQKWSPFYGVVKRAMNRAPAPRDTWWDDHKRKCGGEFTKIKEPENYGKRKAKGKSKDSSTLKEKGKNLSTDLKPKLPTFFDKLKKSQTDKSKAGNEEASKGRDISLSDSSDENLEHSPKKTKTEHSTELSTVIAFSGKGHVLGSTKTTAIETKREKHPLELITTNNKGNKTSKTISSGKGIGTLEGNVAEGSNMSKSGKEQAIKHLAKHKHDIHNLPSTSGISNKISTNRHQAPSTSKSISSESTTNLEKGPSSSSKVTKKKTTPSLTIIDAFAKCKDSANARDSDVEGTKNKPINLCEENTKNVTCPSCQRSVSLTLINSHLDQCLTA